MYDLRYGISLTTLLGEIVRSCNDLSTDVCLRAVFRFVWQGTFVVHLQMESAIN
jgi:hypothetical protein